MPTTARLAVVLVVALLAGSGCAASSDGPADGASPSAPSTTATATATTTTTTTSPTASPTATTGGGVTLPDDLRTRPAVVAALADAAGRQGVAPEQVLIARWSPVTWNDGSIGCPEKGRAYTQALVDGELLVLRVGTGLLQYHAATDRPFTYCASPTAGYVVGG